MRAPSAPGLCLAFGTWRGADGWPEPISPYAAGKGATPELAALSCLGEMAENLCLGAAAHARQRPAFQHLSGKPFKFEPMYALVRDLGDPNDPGSEGCAAGETPEDAIQVAMCERFERAAIRLWWTGEEKAVPLSSEWLRDAGLQDYGKELRRDDPEHRGAVKYYLIGTGLPHATIIAAGQDRDGAEIALGYGCAVDPAIAARKALEEVILQELPLLTGKGKAHPDLNDEERRARIRSAHVVAEWGGLFAPDMVTVRPKAQDKAAHAKIALGAVLLGVNGLAVARVIAPDFPPLRPLCLGKSPAPL